MKKLFFIIPVLVFASFISCKKAKGPASVPSIQPNNGINSLLNMSAIINKQMWETDSAYSYKVKQSGNDSGIVNLMVIATRKKDSIHNTSTIVININDYTGPTTYAVDPPTYAITYYDGKIRHYATTGRFTVLSDTGQMLKGIFNFVADSIKVDAGSFTVALP